MRDIVDREGAGAFPDAQDDQTALAAPGLIVLGITALAVGMADAEIAFPAAGALVFLTLCGGLGQILIAARDWNRKNAFSSTVFASYGLFWLSLVPLVLLPRTGDSASPQSQALAAYLAFWGIYSIVLFGAFSKKDAAPRLVFAFLAAFLLLAATGAATRSMAMQAAAGYAGILVGLDAVAVGLVRHIAQRRGGASLLCGGVRI